MKLSPKSWHYRLYVFMSQWNAAWRHKEGFIDHPYHGTTIGLCPYMRMILIWGPLAILSNLIPIAAIAAALVMFPMAANGAAGIGWLLFWVGLTLASIITTVKVVDWRNAKKEENEKSQVPYWDADEEEKPESFFKLVYAWVHNKVCPVLEIKND